MQKLAILVTLLCIISAYSFCTTENCEWCSNDHRYCVQCLDGNYLNRNNRDRYGHRNGTCDPCIDKCISCENNYSCKKCSDDLIYNATLNQCVDTSNTLNS